MPIWSVVTEEEIIETLNVAHRVTEEKFAHFLVHYATSDGMIPEQELMWVRQVCVSWYLRCRVDEWLMTGLDPDGSESPSERDLSRAPGAFLAAQRYVEKYQVGMVSVPGPPGMTIMPGDVPQSSGEWLDFFMEALEEADRLLTGFMASDWKESLGKCRHRPCGRYFLLKKSRRCYRHGTFCCRQHQNLGSGGASTSKRRAWAKDELIEFAAKQLVEWGIDDSQWQANPAQKRHLAAAVSRRISRDPNLQGYRQEVKVNWVTRRRSEIEGKRYELTQKYAARDVVAGNREVDRHSAPVEGQTHDFHRYPLGFPPVMARAIIKQCRRPGDTVLDPFGGWGTVGEEARALGRNAVIIQPDPTRSRGGKNRTRGAERRES